MYLLHSGVDACYVDVAAISYQVLPLLLASLTRLRLMVINRGTTNKQVVSIFDIWIENFKKLLTLPT